MVVGGWNVELQAVPSGFMPVSFNWTIDPGASSQQTNSGPIITVFLPVGARGRPLVYTHTISVTASDAQGETAQGAYTLIFSNPDYSGF